MHLPLVIASLGESLEWLHVLAVVLGRKLPLTGKLYIRQSWKPVLVYGKPPVQRRRWADDLITGAGMDKGLHHWQQSEAEAARLVEDFSEPDELVVDPFVGSGTVAALEGALKARSNANPSVWLLLALAHHGAGRADQARQWFDKAQTWIKAESSVMQRLPWSERVVLEQLRREAAQALDRKMP
jgi:hypothetical protein